MKLETTTQEVITHLPENAESIKYGIAVNAKMFDILFSGIYQHKIAAIVREITTNAYDSHVAAGRSDTPFRVTIPNSMHPYFEVEDFGVGMDFETAKNVYTMMGESTKLNSNDEAGAWGLGCKTPFAYTSQFTVRMRKDGVERVAICFMDEDGGPRMDFINTVSTTEPNGVKITVPVLEDHIDEFRDEASFYLSFFPTKPIVVGSDFQLLYEIDEDILKNKDVSYFYAGVKNPYARISTSSESVYVLSGPVAYPIDLHTLVDYRTCFTENEFSLLYEQASRRNPLFIKTDIGEVEPSTSREGLQMTAKTKDAIRKRCYQIAKDIIRDFNVIAEDQSKHINHRLLELDSKFGEMIRYMMRITPNAEWVGARGERLFGRTIRNSKKHHEYTPSILRVLSNASNTRVKYYNHDYTIYELFGMAVENTPYRVAKSISPERYFVAPSELDAAIAEAELRIITNERGMKIRGSVIRDYAHTDRAIVVKRITPSSAKRMERVIGCKVTLIDYYDLHKQDLAERKKNRDKNSTPRMKYEDNEVFGSYYDVHIDRSGDMLLEYTANEWSDIDDKPSFFVYGTDGQMTLTEDGAYLFDINDMLEFLRGSLNRDKITELGGSIRVYRKTNRNRTKLDRNNVQSLLSQVEDGMFVSMYDAVVSGVRGYISTTDIDMISWALDLGVQFPEPISRKVLNDIRNASPNMVVSISEIYPTYSHVVHTVKSHIRLLYDWLSHFVFENAVLIDFRRLRENIALNGSLSRSKKYVEQATAYLRSVLAEKAASESSEVESTSSVDKKVPIAA